MPDAFDLEPFVRAEAPAWFRATLEVPFEQRSVTVAGCAINYLRWAGQDDRGLVFVHGGGAHAHWWTHVAATFAPHATCVAVDLSGHGDSGRREEYDLETWTDEVVAVAADAGIDRPIVVGHSMGGFVTIATAARHTGLAGIVIVDSPVVEADAEVSAAQSQTTFAAPLTYTDLDLAISRFRTIPPQANYLDYVLDHVARRSLRRVDHGWQWKFDPAFWRAMRGSPRTTALPYLGKIACRVALLRCEEGLVDLDIGRFMYDEMGRVTPVIELPTAGHHPMLDTPLILITALRSLFADWIHSEPRRRPR